MDKSEHRFSAPSNMIVIGPSDDRNIVGAERPNPATVSKDDWKRALESKIVKAMVDEGQISVTSTSGGVSLENRTRQPIHIPLTQPAAA